MVSSLGSRPAASSTVSKTGHKIARLAQLHLKLSAYQEQLSALERQCSSAETKARDKQVLSSKIADLKAEIAELATSDTSPAARAAEDAEERQRSKAQSAERSPLDAVRLALVKEGHLGTLANLRA